MELWQVWWVKIHFFYFTVEINYFVLVVDIHFCSNGCVIIIIILNVMLCFIIFLSYKYLYPPNKLNILGVSLWGYYIHRLRSWTRDCLRECLCRGSKSIVWRLFDMATIINVFFFGVWGSNPRPCTYYASSLITELSSRD